MFSFSSRPNSSSLNKDLSRFDRLISPSHSAISRHLKNQSQSNQQLSSLIHSELIRKTASDYDSMTSAIILNSSSNQQRVKSRVATSLKLRKQPTCEVKMPTFWLISRSHTKKGTVKIIQQHLLAQKAQKGKCSPLGEQSNVKSSLSDKILLKNIAIIKENRLNKIEDMRPRNIFHMMKSKMIAEQNKMSHLFYDANKQRANNEKFLQIFTTRIISSRRNLKL